ncbi:MAG: hypothetical protein K6C69_06935 [Lachnospiraceae bacterium]|nr:hypothetical protein [Lachnospiraceae bacterium]
MNIFYGMSASGNIEEALRGLNTPKLIILMTTNDNFEKHVAKVEEKFPKVPSIGCIAMGYSKNVVEKGVAIVAFCDSVTVAANILENVSKMPARHIERLEKDLHTVNPGRDNTAIIDFCSGNDACVLTSISPLCKRYGIQLMGATGDQGKVSCNGKIYPDGMAYAVIKNNTGRVKTYKENIYVPMEGIRLIASKTDREKYYMGELNGQSAKQVYMKLLNIQEKDIGTQTFKNPFGKMIGDDICIISIKEVVGNGLACYRQVNDSDILTLLEARDINEIAQQTMDKIRADFNHISGVFSVNCAFRYIMFTENGRLNEYLQKMSTLGTHCGLVGYGEHYNNQFVNQTMTCVVFE